MKKYIRLSALFISALLSSQAFGYITLTGDGTDDQTWAEQVTSARFDKKSGNYYFGLNDDATAYNISYANYRNTNVTALSVIPMAIGTNIDSNITQMALSDSPNYPLDPTLLVVNDNNLATLYGLTIQNNTPSTGVVFGEASTDNPPDQSNGIVALAGGNDLFFAAVLNDEGNPYGANLSGIGAGVISRDSTGQVTLTAYDPVAGTIDTGAQVHTVEADVLVNPDGNYATDSDGTTKSTAFAFGSNSSATVAPAYGADMWYDPIIGLNSDGDGAAGRLFVGAALSSTVPAAGFNNTWGVGTFIVNYTGTSLTVTPTKLYASSAFNTYAQPSFYPIVVSSEPGEAHAQNIEVTKVRTMHTSTGLVYLIVSKGAARANQTIKDDNSVFAIPLVNGSGAAYTDGLGADSTVFVDGNFTQQVLPDNLGTGNLTDLANVLNPATLVGGFYINPTTDTITSLSVPCGPGAAIDTFVNSSISDMYVDNDAVYVATSGPTNGTEQGLWKSQAIFNALGQIDHWTDWQKVIPSDMGDLFQVGQDGSVNFAAVDGYTGHVWAINSAAKTVNVTKWSQPTSLTQEGLASAVNLALNNLCYSVLDLNASTTNWGSETVMRITLFGGDNKVCFASTGTAVAVDGIGTTTNVNLSTIDTDSNYFDSANFFVSELPEGAGAVISLGYSAWTANAAGNGGDNNAYNTPGFFLAGCAGTAKTSPAVYVYVQDVDSDSGFNPQDIVGLSDFNTPNAGWIKLASVTGLPVRIQALGGNLHILGRSYANGDQIFTGAKSDTVTDLDASFVVTAQSANSASQFLDFVISVSAQASDFAPTAGAEQLLALTSDGIYTTACALGMNAATADLNPEVAGWVRIANPPVETEGWFADYLAQADYNRYPQTFHFANFVANANIPYANGTIFNRMSWYQLNRASFGLTYNGDFNVDVYSGTLDQAVAYGEEPSQTATYNVAQGFAQATAPTIYSNFPVNARLLYDDGSRRFFIQARPTTASEYQLFVLPYNAYEYGITTGNKPPLQAAVLSQATGFFWASSIGDLGRLTISTNLGLVSLQ